jgi:hypothetical protein
MVRAYYSLLVVVLGVSFHVQAGSVYLGYSQTEQISVAGNRTLSLDPSGNVVLMSFDLSDNWSLSVDYADLGDSTALTNNATGKLNIQSWGAGVSYYWGPWSWSANYSSWQDDLSISLASTEQTLFNQNSKSPSSALSVAYNWDLTHWQLSLMAGMHYGEWRQTQKSLNRETQTAQSSLDGGSSTFVSLHLMLARLISVGGQEDLILGGSLGWNQLTNSGSAAIARNGRNVSQINNRTIINRLSAAAVTGTESYGQLNFYTSYSLTDDWLVDFDVTFDLGSEENTQAWSVNLGYFF